MVRTRALSPPPFKAAEKDTSIQASGVWKAALEESRGDVVVAARSRQSVDDEGSVTNDAPPNTPSAPCCGALNGPARRDRLDPTEARRSGAHGAWLMGLPEPSDIDRPLHCCTGRPQAKFPGKNRRRLERRARLFLCDDGGGTAACACRSRKQTDQLSRPARKTDRNSQAEQKALQRGTRAVARDPRAHTTRSRGPRQDIQDQEIRDHAAGKSRDR